MTTTIETKVKQINKRFILNKKGDKLNFFAKVSLMKSY